MCPRRVSADEDVIGPPTRMVRHSGVLVTVLSISSVKRSIRTGGAVAVFVLAMTLIGCTSDSSKPKAANSSSSSEPARKPNVQPAVLEGPITVGQIAPPADPRAVDLNAIGYTQEEFFASGTA